MSKSFYLWAAFSCMCAAQSLYGQEGTRTRILTYKTIDTISLKMDCIYPEGFVADNPRPAIVFFFGGGWRSGSIEQFRPHARYFAHRGIIAVLADYRVEKRQGTTPFDAVADAKSAIRYLREHAPDMGIDPEKLIASGGSAGGHLAAATATLTGLDEPDENPDISSRADALLLFNPVFDNGPGGYGYERCGGEARYREISPIDNIRPGAPPTIVFLGTEDPLIPVATAERYKNLMQSAGNRCELLLYEGQKHGFFNYRNKDLYIATVSAADAFLSSLGYLSGGIDIEYLKAQ